MKFSQEKEFDNWYPYFVLLVSLMVSTFSGFLPLFTNTFTVKIVLLLLHLPLICVGKTIYIEKNYGIFFAFYLIISFLFFLINIRSFQYSLNTDMKNFVNSILGVITNLIAISYFHDKKLDKYTFRFFKITVAIELIAYVIYINTRTINYVWSSEIQYSILQDWTGRFSGTFSEPVNMGFYLGLMVFVVLLSFNNWVKYPLLAFLVYIIYFSCKAKLTLVALPAAFLFVIFIIRNVKIKEDSRTLIYIFIIIAAILLSVGYIFPNSVLNFVGKISTITSASNFVTGNRNVSDSFSTRFFFMLAAARNLLIYPFGSGYGMNYEYFGAAFQDLKGLFYKNGISVWELSSYTSEAAAAGMGAKDTYSYVACAYGLPGLYILLKEFSKAANRTYSSNLLCRSLVTFVFFEAVLSANIFSTTYLPYIILVYLVLNEYTINED